MAELIPRSEVNRILTEGLEFLDFMKQPVPAHCRWNMDDWIKYAGNSTAFRDMRQRGIGWDLTDFGSGRYKERGLLLITQSNGKLREGHINVTYDQPYANKILIVGEGQETPMHHHIYKREDIYNDGASGVLEIELYMVGQDGRPNLNADVNIFMNGYSWERMAAGTVLSLGPGERVRLDPVHYHRFWGRKGEGTVLVKETSMVNDDEHDNVFLQEDKVQRFPGILEDVMPLYLLGNECPGTKKFEELVNMWGAK